MAPPTRAPAPTRAPTRAPAQLALLLALLWAPPGLGVPGGGCGAPPPTGCRSGETALPCGARGLCAPPAWAPPDTDACADCQQIVALLTRLANESAAKAAVEGFLRRECAALPVPTMVSPCQDLVHKYFNLLLADIKPSAVCAQLELCPGRPGGVLAVPPSLRAPGTHPQVAAGEALPVPLCWLCRTFLARAEAALPKASVAAAVAGLCRALPVAVAGACQCLAQRYTALALERVLERLGPRLLCRLLLACRARGGGDAPLPLPRGPLGGLAVPDAEDLPVLPPKAGPCALGPTYWCSSPEAAGRCQALRHCQEHVWE